MGQQKSGKFVRNTIAILFLLVAINAFGGGSYGMAGAKHIPVEWLNGTPFRNYFFPSVVLFVFVGGSALIASIVVFKKHMNARKASFISTFIIIIWLSVQVYLIGYVSWLQPPIAIIAMVIFLLTFLLPKYEH